VEALILAAKVTGTLVTGAALFVLTMRYVTRYLAERERIAKLPEAEKAWERGDISFDAFRRIQLGETTLAYELLSNPMRSTIDIQRARQARADRRRKLEGRR
jgi:hypothetical protein